ncbi:MAG TPA: hypothetical protein VFC42_08985 [Methylomirabilota bacterium]|nr:hypothetical protein [Methylomirabilota bacterium]
MALALHPSTPLVRALAFRGSRLTPGALEAQTGGLESMADLKRRAVDLAGPGRSAGVVLAVALAFVIAIVTELMRAGGDLGRTRLLLATAAAGGIALVMVHRALTTRARRGRPLHPARDRRRGPHPDPARNRPDARAA